MSFPNVHGLDADADFDADESVCSIIVHIRVPKDGSDRTYSTQYNVYLLTFACGTLVGAGL